MSDADRFERIHLYRDSEIEAAALWGEQELVWAPDETWNMVLAAVSDSMSKPEWYGFYTHNDTICRL